MSVLFIVPLTIIALYEARLDPSKNRWVRAWLSDEDQGFFDTPEFRDPDVDAEDAAKGLRISIVPFDELIKVFPDSIHVRRFILSRAHVKYQHRLLFLFIFFLGNVAVVDRGSHPARRGEPEDAGGRLRETARGSDGRIYEKTRSAD